jgi:hypothetical protein
MRKVDKIKKKLTDHQYILSRKNACRMIAADFYKRSLWGKTFDRSILYASSDM